LSKERRGSEKCSALAVLCDQVVDSLDVVLRGLAGVIAPYPLEASILDTHFFVEQSATRE
jgi:hypothetical protein